jgi:uncharacterized Zn finger protein
MEQSKLNNVMGRLAFNQYMEQIKTAGLNRLTLYGFLPFTGCVDPNGRRDFIMIGDLGKWCSLKPDCRN